MNSESVDKTEFWNRKILNWENKNYRGGLLWGSPIRWRKRLFLSIAKPKLKDSSVFEGGCGSGLIIEDLFAAGARSYVGCDISKSAINEAKNRAAKLGLVSKTEFYEASVLDIKDAAVDFSFSLGLWDWLTDQEILQFLKSVSCKHFLHSFSERRPSVSQVLHRVYVYAAYGHNDMHYTPKYRSSGEVFEFVKNADILPSIYRDNRMSFSSFVHSLGKKIET